MTSKRFRWTAKFLAKMLGRGYTKQDVGHMYYRGAKAPAFQLGERPRFARTMKIRGWTVKLIYIEFATEVEPVSIQRQTRNPKWQEGEQ